MSDEDEKEGLGFWGRVTVVHQVAGQAHKRWRKVPRGVQKGYCGMKREEKRARASECRGPQKGGGPEWKATRKKKTSGQREGQEGRRGEESVGGGEG